MSTNPVESEPGRAGARPSRAWLIVGLVTVFILVNFADKVVVGLAGVELMRDLDITPAQFGLVQSSFYWLFAIGSIGGGLLIGRVPAKWLLSGTAALWALAMLPMLWSESFAVLIASRMMLGLAEGPATAMALAVVHSWFTADKRTIPTSIVTAGAGIGPLLAAPLLTTVIVNHSWHAAFGALVLVGALWLPLWMAFGRWGDADSEPVARIAAGSEERIPAMKLLTNRTLIGVAVLMFAMYSSAAIKLSWLPVYFRQGLGYDAASAGRFVALTYLAVAVMVLVTGWVSRVMTKRGVQYRLSRGVFPASLVVAAGVSTLVFAQLGRGLPNLLLIVVGASLASASAGVAMSAVSDVVPQSQRGSVMGALVAFYSMAGVFAPLVLGAIVGGAETPMAGYRSGFGLLGLVVIVGGVLGGLLIDPVRDRPGRVAQGDVGSLAARSID
ncbi:MFS transporter [Rhodococcus pseudokoreensis]|uniref:MFS transporter n=2 Tax=Rhodococcus pseudokoreensis TaxID=2811421 RepID=A0A974WCW3_9NOCA|nr:MFS transporter [Rhodococcus pseudokoreensis]